MGGADGLDLIRRLLAQVRDARAIGSVALEIGSPQADAVAKLAGTAGFTEVERVRDLAGIERVDRGRR